MSNIIVSRRSIKVDFESEKTLKPILHGDIIDLYNNKETIFDRSFKIMRKGESHNERK